MRYFSNEIVFRGHPDRVCDQISAAILKECVIQDKNTRAGIEVTGGKGKIFVTGEVTTKASFVVEDIVKRVLRDVGYDDNYEVIDNLGKQSPDIAQGVDIGGAGDQGMMFGYACDDTDKMLPKAMVILQEFALYYDLLRTYDDRFLPDGKAQITGLYDDDFKLVKIKDFTISYQNTEVEREETDSILRGAAKDICEKYGITEIERFLINPTGKFLIGGFDGDAGLTGRKIVVDAYQGFANVGGGCVDYDTEFLTPNGWKKIGEYQVGDMVAQWENGDLTFVHPISYIKTPSEPLYHFKTTNNLEMIVSENHNVLYRTSKKNYIKKTTKELLNEYQLKSSGCRAEIPLWFNNDFNNCKGILLTDDAMRLQIAFCADGTLLSDNKGRIRVKKQYKKERLRTLLMSVGCEYKETFDNEYSIFWLKPPIYSKSLKECFSDMNRRQAEIFCDEIFKWDGDRKSIFRTTNEEDADFVQYILMGVTNKSVSIYVDDRIGRQKGKYVIKSKCYQVHVNKYQFSTALRKGTIRTANLSIAEFSPQDGLMYCFNVPSHNLILRCNKNVYITGNCQNGKDATKVDFSASHMARRIACEYLKSHNLKWCEVQLSYAIGIAEPLAIYIDSNIGYIEPEQSLYQRCTPANIIKELNLLEADYEELAKFGHYTKADV